MDHGIHVCVLRVQKIYDIEKYKERNRKMKNFSYVITDPEGIHARPAGQLVKLVKSFNSTIMISKDGKSVKASKTLGVMSLGAKQGSTVEFTFEGDDEDAACEAVSKFMQENL